MYELTRYFDTWLLQAAWEVGASVDVTMTHDSLRPFQFEYDKTQFMAHPAVSRTDSSIALMQLASLGRFMRRGPVIVVPTPVLTQALIDTEIRLPVRDYKQPYEVMGVELPPSVVGPAYPCLTIVWRPSDEAIFVWTTLKSRETLHFSIGNDLATIEDRLGEKRGENLTEQDWRILVQGTRIALNLCMLASSRPTETTPLPAKVARHRRRPEERLQQLAGRHCQEVRFKDLIVKPRPLRDVLEGHGQPQGKQRRRGHWKNAAYGPRFSLHRWVWVDEYETRRDEDSNPPATTILK